MSDFKPYLQSAHIEGYKSIVSCDVTFKPGLNIIIGKNGTGKTNLLEGMRMGLQADADALSYEPMLQIRLIFEDTIDHRGAPYGIIVKRPDFSMEEDEAEPGDASFKDYNEDKHKIEFFAGGEIYDLLKDEFPVDLETQLIPFEIPKLIPLLNDRESGWNIEGKRAIPQRSKTQPIRVFKILLSHVAASLSKKLNGNPPLECDKIIVQELRDFAKSVLPLVRQCSPITNISVSPGQIDSGQLANQLIVRGYRLIFEINGRFHSYDQLSDGTKRVLLIACELAKFPNRNEYLMDAYASAFLLEEPELGIHPHQLHKLMNFLKEQAEQKQIIITTHSPQVLDILNQDELDHIIIAEFDPEKGSTFRHLTEKELKKARFIMKEEPLSHYWRYSDLDRNPILI